MNNANISSKKSVVFTSFFEVFLSGFIALLGPSLRLQCKDNKPLV